MKKNIIFTKVTFLLDRSRGAFGIRQMFKHLLNPLDSRTKFIFSIDLPQSSHFAAAQFRSISLCHQRCSACNAGDASVCESGGTERVPALTPVHCTWFPSLLAPAQSH